MYTCMEYEFNHTKYHTAHPLHLSQWNVKPVLCVCVYTTAAVNLTISAGVGLHFRQESELLLCWPDPGRT